MTTVTRISGIALKDASILTIATGAVTVNRQYHKIAAQSGTTDDLDTITLGFTTLEVASITFRPMLCITADAGDTITIKHGTGNITLPDDTDVVITDGEFYWLLWNGTAWKGHVIGAGGSPSASVTGHRFEARLSLSSTLPVPTSNITAATTLYLLPYKGNVIDLYDGSADFDEFELGSGGISVAIPSTTNTNYDVFVYDSGGLALDLVAWNVDNVTRVTNLVKIDGTEVKDGATARRYAGTIRTTGVSGQCETSFSGTTPNWYVWNRYNQQPVSISIIEGANSWTNNVALTWRSANASTANRVNVVVGLNESQFTGLVYGYVSSATSQYMAYGVALDATNTNHAQFFGSFATSNGLSITGMYSGFSGIGAHFYQWVEQQSSTNVGAYYGDNAGITIQAGMSIAGMF